MQLCNKYLTGYEKYTQVHVQTIRHTVTSFKIKTTLAHWTHHVLLEEHQIINDLSVLYQRMLMNLD